MKDVCQRTASAFQPHTQSVLDLQVKRLICLTNHTAGRLLAGRWTAQTWHAPRRRSQLTMLEEVDLGDAVRGMARVCVCVYIYIWPAQNFAVSRLQGYIIPTE